MRRTFPVWIVLVALAAPCLTGCKPRLYRAETVLNADGSIGRAVYQPVQDTPEWAANPENWSGVTFAERIDDDAWRGKISDLPAAERDKDRNYLAAWGEFAAPDHMPQTFVKPAPGGLPSGVLAIDYERNDYVLVIEHKWRETLTDIVTLDDMQRARRELADLLLPLAEKILAEGFGPEYDVTGLVDWLHNSGTQLGFEMTNVVFDVGTRGYDPRWNDLALGLEPVLLRYGLKLRGEDGNLLEDGALTQTLKQFIEDLVRKHVRRHDGQPIPDERIEELLAWFGNGQAEEAETAKPNRFADAAGRAIREMHGSDEAFSEALAPLSARILGLYRSEILGPARRFDYVMQMPGTIVETSGLIVGEDRTRWKFSADEAYPAGFAMECRSLDEQKELEQQVFGKRVFEDREKLLRYVELVRDNAELLDALKQCAAEKSPQPLLAERDRTAPASKLAKSYDALIELLGVEKK